MSDRIEAARARVINSLSYDDMRKLTVFDIARYRLDVKYLLKILSERDAEIKRLRIAAGEAEAQK